MWKVFGLMVWGLLPLFLCITPTVCAAPGPSVMVHFDNNKAFLSDADKDKLRNLFQTYDVQAAGRVFILGYTDSHGNKQYNYKLSRRRAQSVRLEIINAFGIDATVVMAMGKGAENPIADNAKADGRARNRRAEIYLANATMRRPKRTYGPDDPHSSTIAAFVKQADDLIRKRRINDAMQKLQQAHALGGDHYTDWHTAMGIAGFYADVPSDRIKAHLATAVKIDPYNYKAREFLSRIEARRLVAGGKITPQMGRTAKDAIAVTVVAQAHEYLRLFGVQALAHRKLDLESVVVWDCRDQNGDRVSYYFDHSQTFSWAFARNSTGAQSQPMRSAPEPAISSSNTDSRTDAHLEKPSAGSEQQPVSDLADNPQRIWQSTLFK